MKGLVFLGEYKIEFRDFPDPVPGPGEVVLEIKASGMCGSDLKAYRMNRGDWSKAVGLSLSASPVIQGHEPCGVVAAVGPYVSELQARVGLRVMVHHYVGCGVCKHCRSGWPQICLRKAVAFSASGHGSHAKYMKVPATTLVPLPDELSFEAGASISCGTGTAYSALRRIGLSGCETIAIFGQGPVGLSATQLAKTMGARVIAVDVNEQRLALAKELGADVTIDSRKEAPVEAVNQLTHGEGAELALDCSGNADGMLAAIRSTCTWGTIGLVGIGGTLTVNVSPELIIRQRTLVGSYTFSIAGLAECARFVADRKIPVDKLYTLRYPLEQAAEAYRLFDTQSTGKGVLLP